MIRRSDGRCFALSEIPTVQAAPMIDPVYSIASTRGWGLANTMKWGRGFFRAWVVLTALWIGLTVYVQEPETYRLWSSSVYEITDPDGHTGEFNLAKKSQTELAAEITAWIRTQRPDIDDAQRLKDRDRILARLTANHQADRDEAARAWQFSIVPPLMLLGLGLCIFWIARGFRPRT